MQKKILVVVPSYNGEICIELVPFLMEAAGQAVFYPILHKPTDVARNLAASMAKSMNCHLCMVDADAAPAPGTFQALKEKIEEKVCVVAVPYVAATGQICVGETAPAVAEVEHLEGFHEVENFGTHCCMIHRLVFDLVPSPFFEYHYNGDHSSIAGYAEDTVFGRKVRAAGIPIYVNYSYWAGHIVWTNKTKPRSLTETERFLVKLGL